MKMIMSSQELESSEALSHVLAELRARVACACHTQRNDYQNELRRELN